MDKEKLKLIVRNLELLVDSLKAEVYSDTQKRLEYQQQMMQQPQQYNETYRGVKFVKDGHK